ncbi:hypothetical protein K7573_06635 [Stenotrophomonas maltophilia]|uniref:hypothetical protein n=1 Tax=Stenotrophomonas maltophilia TaxID=40324 RepID=UPI000518454E|nr:hypothetical protein [Stenotrophomonas maltophilia]PZS61966.1 hypothetical protein A7X58_05175 [Stenotrophomonas maltophilia]PZS76707.1 hypothetical protein A7X63_19975 [Stenotrophomonas maltophilia]UXF77869.1 hypothetical protein K7573_06635 [Stenotrophomonas maltophilia]
MAICDAGKQRARISQQALGHDPERHSRQAEGQARCKRHAHRLQARALQLAFQAQRLQVVEVYRQRDAGAGPATVAGAGDGLVLAGEETQEGLMATEGGAGIGQRRDSARRSRVQRMACSRRGSIRPNRVSDGCR